MIPFFLGGKGKSSLAYLETSAAAASAVALAGAVQIGLL